MAVGSSQGLHSPILISLPNWYRCPRGHHSTHCSISAAKLRPAGQSRGTLQMSSLTYIPSCGQVHWSACVVYVTGCDLSPGRLTVATCDLRTMLLGQAS